MGGTFHLLPEHLRQALIEDPMYLQRKHDEEVARYRFLTGADVWVPHSERKARP